MPQQGFNSINVKTFKKTIHFERIRESTLFSAKSCSISIIFGGN